MIASELINHMIPPLKLTDDGDKAITWMEEFRLNQLPVVDGGRFIGLISEEIIFETNEASKPIVAYDLIGKNCFVDQNAHFYNIIKLASDNNVQVVGVMDDEGHYAGVITVQDIITSFAQTAAVQVPGGIIVISLAKIDYSLAEISRLIEENNAKILSSSVRNDVLDSSKIKLTLKVSQTELSKIIATLERFEYKIIARYQESKVEDNEKEKIDMLFKFLDI